MKVIYRLYIVIKIKFRWKIEASNFNLELFKMEQAFLNHRSSEIAPFKDHPIFLFLRTLRTQLAKQDLLFYFGEINNTITFYKWSITDEQIQYKDIIQSAFLTVCPNIKLEYTRCEFFGCFLTVEWQSGQMDPIVFNKSIFPNYCIVDKNTLEF